MNTRFDHIVCGLYKLDRALTSFLKGFFLSYWLYLAIDLVDCLHIFVKRYLFVKVTIRFNHIKLRRKESYAGWKIDETDL